MLLKLQNRQSRRPSLLPMPSSAGSGAKGRRPYMFRMHCQFALVLAVAGLLWIPELSVAQDSPVQGQVAVATAAGSPAVLAELRRGEAVVIYENAALIIAAQSAPLIDVLRQVCSQIGAELDAPSEATELTVGFFGPGPARE